MKILKIQFWGSFLLLIQTSNKSSDVHGFLGSSKLSNISATTFKTATQSTSTLKSYISVNNFVLNSSSANTTTTSPVSSTKQSNQISTNLNNNNNSNGIIRNIRGSSFGLIEMLTVFLDNENRITC
ncbi:hypothetical protein PPL_09514 [Heterostelium album PN500]|uniref:Uncharacterized protein n=1 Tax=Heterostelium pallidum (strain ATCC 26659 / Pp 5 / PN500) TaxID=670386 RepID=D3BNA3_HETP5|nr:hypothetical protein PPL_09514 [Heterostelium album PN500]EFA76763.1 hypothetical protein PPL_09514 [Heterostelium album PN500]|eukprot:XP_020428895.1 hypothetical protein PPL_09514 [Heterostelium album PN500]